VRLRYVVPFAAYALYSAARGDLRPEHLIVLTIVLALAYGGRLVPRFASSAPELLAGLFPVGLVFILYDGMRPYQKIGLSESRVHLCDLRALEARFFGAGGSTLHDFFYVHHVTALDLFCAIPYATFILWCVAGGIWLYAKDRPAMRRFMWGFFALNALGFVTYHVLPAAPPWYFHARGCTVDLAQRASEGPALARVDAFLGVAYFHSMYAKASSVFGALPSLHCAYPFLLLIEGWRAFKPWMRAAAIAYWALMVFSAVYLDHHWVIDALMGTVYAVLVAASVRLLQRPVREPVVA
jgi:inositol phosphorylceramide synthase catalytic subunit